MASSTECVSGYDENFQLKIKYISDIIFLDLVMMSPQHRASMTPQTLSRSLECT